VEEIIGVIEAFFYLKFTKFKQFPKFRIFRTSIRVGETLLDVISHSQKSSSPTSNMGEYKDKDLSKKSHIFTQALS
jgi:hypothetical protein